MHQQATQLQRYVVVDIVTFPTANFAQAIEIGVPSKRIIALSLLIDDGAKISEYSFAGADESALLRQFWKMIHPGDLFIGRSTLEFDLSLVRQRSLINGIRPQNTIELQRFFSHDLVDLIHLRAAWQGSHAPKSPELAALLEPHWPAVRSAKINTWWREQDFLSIAGYAIHNLRLIYRSFLCLECQSVPKRFHDAVSRRC